jgi:hypothetical protein
MHGRHRAFFGGILVDDIRIRKVATTWAASLVLAASAGINHDKELLILSLFPERHGAPFWATPVGRLLAWVGSASESDADPVPSAGAALALGVVKQRSSQMVSEGKLVKHPDGGVTRESLRDRMRERWPVT